MDIHYEIESAKLIIISNESELIFIVDKYFSKDGILPKIYKMATVESGKRSDRILHQLVELRSIVDVKIREYKKSIT